MFFLNWRFDLLPGLWHSGFAEDREASAGLGQVSRMFAPLGQSLCDPRSDSWSHDSNGPELEEQVVRNVSNRDRRRKSGATLAEHQGNCPK